MLDQQIRDFNTKTPVKYWEESWNEKAGAHWWRNHTCKFPPKEKPLLRKPFVMIKEKLDPNTVRRKIIKWNLAQFKKEESADKQIKSYVVQDMDKPETEFEVEYSSGGRVRRGLAYAGVPTIAIGFGLFGEAIFSAIFSAASHNCIGEVQIYALPKDIEPHTLTEMVSNQKRILEQIEIERIELKKNQSKNEASLIKKIRMEIENNQKKLMTISTFVDDTRKIWEEQYTGEYLEVRLKR